MNIKHICIFTQSPLVSAPRVVKEANVYGNAGFQVTVFALWYDPNLVEKDRALLHHSIDFRAGAKLYSTTNLSQFFYRGIRKIARILVYYAGIQTKHALGYNYWGYLKDLLQTNADLYIGHEEMSLALAKELIKKGKKVAFDFEDWHSKDLLPKDRVYRPIKLLEHLEKHLLNHATYCYTTSDAMADALSGFHNAPKPEVIYNSFWASQRVNMDGKHKDLQHHKCPSVYWFSQVIGPGRGLELLFAALPIIETPFQLHLRGMISENYRQHIIALTPKHIELYIHDLVPPEELISRISEHDLGIAFEETKPESRNYTITNKVFHYLQSGIPILATETAGQNEVAHKAPYAIKIVMRQPDEIAKTLDVLFTNSEELKRMKEASWHEGSDIFSFEKMEYKLLNLLQTQLHT